MKIQKEIENVERITNRQPVEPLTMEDAVIQHKKAVDNYEKARKEIDKELGIEDIEEEGFTGASKEPKKVSTPELKKMKLAESLFESVNEAVDGDTIIIETGLTDDAAQEALDSILGQLSDGIWENSPRMEKYWKNIDIEPDGRIIIKNRYLFDDEAAARKWLAGKLKQIVKVWAKDCENDPHYFKNVDDTSWSRSNNNPCQYLGYEGNVTVKDAYRVYDNLLNRKIRISEELEETDGWGDEIEYRLEEIFSRLENLMYEIRNCRRGVYTGCETAEELADLLHMIANDLDECSQDINADKNNINEETIMRAGDINDEEIERKQAEEERKAEEEEKKRAEKKKEQAEKAWEEKDWIAEREKAQEQNKELDLSRYSKEEQEVIKKNLDAFDKDETAQARYQRKKEAEKAKEAEEKVKEAEERRAKRRESTMKAISNAGKAPGEMVDAVKKGLSKSGIRIS